MDSRLKRTGMTKGTRVIMPIQAGIQEREQKGAGKN